MLSSILIGRSIINVGEAMLLQQILEAVGLCLSKAKRRCINKNIECTYKEGACYVKMSKGANWKLQDIKNCPYYKPIKEGGNT